MIENERLHELDSLRGIAAVGVIAWHYTNHFHASPFPRLMAPFYGHGLLLVDFFFVLSGFVLARTYWNDSRSSDFRSNLRDRIARIYPLHVITLCAVALLQWLLTHRLDSPPFVYAANDTRNFVLNLLLLNKSGLERGWSFNAPSWSISAEFIVNLAFLATITARKRIAAVTMAIACAISMAIVCRNGLISNSSFMGLDNDIFRAMLGFCIGVALQKLDATITEIRIHRMIYDAIAIASAAWFLYYCSSSDFSNKMDLIVALIGFPALIIGSIRGSIIRQTLRIPPLVFLGTISYSLYLVHFPLQLVTHIVGVASGHDMPYASRAFFVAFMLATIALSWVTYHVVEVPGKSAIKRITSRQSLTASRHG